MTEETKSKRSALKPRSLGVTHLANAEIDSRLAQAIRDRARAIAMVSKLVHWQDRLGRLEQEINSLIGFQQRLLGQVPAENMVAFPSNIVPAPFTGHLSPIPEGVTSIPSRQPKPTTPNVADVVGKEGGFS